MNILAIESSCDETSVSIVKDGCEEISTVVLSQMDVHKQFGGVVPEIASRYHVQNITMIIEECLEQAKMTMDDVDAVAVTYGPGLNGALLVGIEAAKALAYVSKKPLIKVHHIAGHIYANRLESEFKFPLISLVISGGHTEIIYMKNHYTFKKIGGTLDDAVGEAYDKIARVINLPYPGGPLIDKLSYEGSVTYDLPIPLNDNSYNFSFSGIKSAVINLVHNETQRGKEINSADLAATFQDRVVNILVKKTMRAVKEYGVEQLLIAGGVSANSLVRSSFTIACEEQGVELLIPKLKYCTDNATMIAAAAYYAYQKGNIADMNLNAVSSLPLEEI